TWGQIQTHCHLQGDRHQQGQGTYIIHKTGQHGSKQRQKKYAEGGTADGWKYPAGEQIDRASLLQAITEHQHAGNGNNSWMAKPGESLFRRHQTREYTKQQGSAGNHVMAPAPPDKHDQTQDQNGDYRKLVPGHGWFFLLM